jgi:hypothetical protein
MKLFEIHDQFMPKGFGDAEVKTVSNLIKRDCTKFVEAYRRSGKFLYRGVVAAAGMDLSAFSANIRQDRKPVDMPAGLHSFINSAMIKAGITAHRGNSIFCTTDVDTADNWGYLFAIFVKDGWSGTVFDAVRDDYSYHSLKKAAMKYYTLPEQVGLDLMVEKLLDLKPTQFSSAAELHDVINSRHQDVMITGEKYYGVAVNTFGRPGWTAKNIMDLILD